MIPNDVSLNWLWGYLVPIGFLLLTWGGLPPQKARRVTPLAALSMALAVLGYWAVGFAFHLGGAHAVNPDDPSLLGLDMLLTPSGAGWGLVGLKGFFLAGQEITPTALALFLSYLPLVMTATLLVVLALSELRLWVMLVAGGLMGSVIFPIAACWAWGSGWLAHMGDTLSLGHGLVDLGGGILTLWLPGMMVLGVLLLQTRCTADVGAEPGVPVYFSLLANVGALFIGVGWTGWALSGPFHVYGMTWDWYRAAVNILLGMAGAVLASQLYAWLVSGGLTSMLAARGLVAGWGAVLTAAPFIPPWMALVLGGVGGGLYPLLLYGVEELLRLRDSAAVIGLGVVAGGLGLLGAGVFADGRWGQGYNGIGAVVAEQSAGGRGVTGLVFGGGMGQVAAQLIGLAVLAGWGLIWGSLLGFAANPRFPRLIRKDVGLQEGELNPDSEMIPVNAVNSPETDFIPDDDIVAVDELDGDGQESDE